MTIKVTTTRNDDNSVHLLRLEITEESLPLFKQMVDRAMNCWDSAPKDLKDMADMLTHGYITQDHTYTPINTKQNTDYNTKETVSKIEEFIQLAGQEAWLEHVRNGTTQKVLKPTSDDLILRT